MLQKPLRLTVPVDAVKFILFQRTQYLFFRRNAVLQWLARSLPPFIASPFETVFTKFNILVSLESIFFGKRVAELFSNEMYAEYKAMEEFLPKKVNSILDIGCGIGGIDVFLNAHYKSDDLKLYLLDKTEMPRKVYYGLMEKGCFYNSFKSVVHFLTKNGISEKQIFIQEANERNTIDFDATFDLVISLISWGFHYPVSVYLDQVYEKLSPGGMLILDVRKSFGGMEMLQEKFGNMQIMHDAAKHSRVVLRKM